MWIMLEKTHIRLMKEADEKSSAKMINLEKEREKMKSDFEKLNFKNNQNLKDLKNLQSSYDEFNFGNFII